SAWNIENRTAGSPREALKLVEENDFDLFILDYVLPETNGIELAQSLRKIEKLKGARIILLTAFHEAGLGEKAIAAGWDAYLTKPLRQAQLYDCLLCLCGTGKFTPPTFRTVTVGDGCKYDRSNGGKQPSSNRSGVVASPGQAISKAYPEISGYQNSQTDAD